MEDHDNPSVLIGMLVTGISGLLVGMLVMFLYMHF